MTAENFDAVLDEFLAHKPFRIFTIALHDGTLFEVDAPSVVYRRGVAVYIAPGSKPIFFDHESVSKIIAAPANAAS